ncbi:MAG: F0F1 ATP synthase subunit delta [Desulfarculus sp.]|nr:F0F1 ATP synthase subunit delta [Desulfarculus sp.]
MTSLVVAKRYAKALLEIGREDGNYEQYGRELAEMASLFQEAPDLPTALANPGFPSASALDQAQIAQLAATLKQVAGREVKLEVKEDSSLIGGVVARIGDLVLDGSVKTQLANLKNSLRRGEYA